MPKFNKMFVMIPVMLLARKLDSEDAKIVHMIRLAYAVVQFICVALVAYTYVQATAVSKKDADRVIFVSSPTAPFGVDPNAKKKYTQTTYGAQVVSTARSLLGSTVFGICLTVGLHYYKGMVMGLAIQAVMAPLNLLENPLVNAIFLSNGIIPENRIFEEKDADELTSNDEVVDERGDPIGRKIVAGGAVPSEQAPSLEDVLLDTWDQGNKADLGPLMKCLNAKNVNYRTRDDQWTPLMILSGLGAKGAVSAIRAAKEMGADITATDKEGWTALHWAAFHGCLPAAQELSSEIHALAVQDKEGHTPIETARKEGNDAVATIYERALGESKKSK